MRELATQTFVVFFFTIPPPPFLYFEVVLLGGGEYVQMSNVEVVANEQKKYFAGLSQAFFVFSRSIYLLSGFIAAQAKARSKEGR